MLPIIHKRTGNLLRLTGVLLLLGFCQPLWAAGPPEPSIFSNPMAITFIVLMLLLLIIIGILAHILIGAADVKLKKRKTGSVSPAAAAMTALFLLSSSSLLAQGGTTAEQTTAAAGTIAGMSPFAFYVMVSVIFLELLIIIVLLINIKFLLKTEKEKLTAAESVAEKAALAEAKKTRLSWWDRFNKLRPVSQEAELDLGHDYDGIRELNNRLPPWWLYGFYASILFAVIYLWRFHVSHTGPSSSEEYERSVARAELKVKEYLKLKGENIDENTVVFLSDKENLAAGKALFEKGACGGCHGMDASGIVSGQNGVGPNLTDDYWIHGGSIKDIFTTIKYGVAGKMQAWSSTYSAKDMAQIASYLKSLKGVKLPKVREPQGELYKEEGDAATPAADSLKTIPDSVKAKENKVAMN